MARRVGFREYKHRDDTFRAIERGDYSVCAQLLPHARPIGSLKVGALNFSNVP